MDWPGIFEGGKEKLKNILRGMEPRVAGGQDAFVWPLDGMEGFLEKTYYLKLQAVARDVSTVPENRVAIKAIWKARMPWKVKIFAWRLLQDRLPTRM